MSDKDDWKKIEKNNLKISLSILYAKKEKKNIQPRPKNITQIVKTTAIFIV